MDTNIETKEVLHEKKEPEQKEIPAKEEEKTMPAGKPKISMKTAVIIGGVIVLGALAFYCKGLFIAATVDGMPISRMSVIRQLESEGGKTALDNMIVKQLLNEEARKKGITVTSEDVTAEIKKIEDQVKAQGGTLDQMLSAQGMTRVILEEQLTIQKKVEKLLADKVEVTDEEAMELLKSSKIAIPKGEEEKYKAQAKEQIRTQKMNSEVGELVDSLKEQAKIRYFVNY